MPATGAYRSRKLQRLLNARWWEFNKGSTLRLRSGNVKGEPFEIEPGPDVAGIIDTATTFQIPSDYSTLQEAVDDLADRIVSRGIVVTLNIESGHELTAGMLLDGGDYSMFRITSDDATVPLSSSFVGVDEADLFDPVTSRTNCLIIGAGTWMPRLDCLIDMGGFGGSDTQDGDGIYLAYNCMMQIGEGAGVTNAGAAGLNTRTSIVWADDAVFDGAHLEGLRITQASTVAAQGASADGCQQGTNRNANGAVFISRSATLHANDILAQNSGTYGITMNRAWCSAQFANVSGAGQLDSPGVGFEASHGAHIIARDAVATNCDRGMEIHSATAEARNIDVSGCEIGIYGRFGAKIQAHEATADNCNDAVRMENGSDCTVEGGSMTGFTRRALWANDGATLNAKNATATTTETGTLEAAICREGSRLNLQDASCDSDNASDILCQTGSIINATGATGVLSKTANGVDSDGIIFQ